MPSGRASFRRNRVAPVAYDFTILDAGRRARNSDSCEMETGGQEIRKSGREEEGKKWKTGRRKAAPRCARRQSE